MAAIIAAHLLLAAWFLLTGGNFGPVRRASNLTAIDISQDLPKPDAPAKPSIVPPVPATRMVALLPSKLTIEAAPAVAGSGLGNGCSVASSVSAALIADQAAMAELAALPAAVRSEADAVMLWNGAWLDADPDPATQVQMAGTPIPELRRAVSDAVLALPAECQEVEMTGPQLLAIPEPGRTTMVVIGSGVWRWSSLIDVPLDPSSDTRTTAQAAQSSGDWKASLGLSGN